MKLLSSSVRMLSLTLTTSFSLVLLLLGSCHSESHMDHHPVTTVIRSYRYRVPDYCRNSFETVDCFERCKEDPRITRVVNTVWSEEQIEIYRQKIVNASLEVLMEETERVSKINGLGPYLGRAIPCNNKCESDPIYWSCMEKCDDHDHTALWTVKCFSDVYNKTANCKQKSINLLEPNCLECLVNATKERLYTSCPLQLLPNLAFPDGNLCHLLSDCDSADPAQKGKVTYKEVVQECALLAKDNIAKMEVCVNDKIAAKQSTCCNTAAVRETLFWDLHLESEEELDDWCEKVLPPRLCREKCSLFRNKSIVSCMEDECNYYYSTDEKICDRCDKGKAEGQQFEKDLQCVSKCKADDNLCVDNCFQGQPASRPQYLLDNCFQRDFIFRFITEFLLKQNGSYGKLEADENHELSSWLVHFKLPFECNQKKCDDVERYPIDTVTLESLCRSNPFRAVDMIACAIVHPDPMFNKLNYSAIYDNQDDFLECMLEVNYDWTRTELYRKMLTFDIGRTCSTMYCNDTTSRKKYLHPNAALNTHCRIFHCQMYGQSPHCSPRTNDYMADSEDFHLCHWDLKFSKWNNPTRLWSTYFDELRPAEVRRDLEFPEVTKVLPKTDFEKKSTYYTFPYFLIVRSVCAGNMYSELNYAQLEKSPVLETKLWPTTNRQKQRSPIAGVFKTALIDLDQGSSTDSDEAIPANLQSVIDIGKNGLKEIGCPKHICYPAFAAPLMIHNIPKFEVQIYNQGLIKSFSRQIHVSQFHSRVKYGRGELFEPSEPASNPVTPHPGQLFPKERATFAVDEELAAHHDCFADFIRPYPPPFDSTRAFESLCPELEFTLTDEDELILVNRFFPIRPEDISRSQVTYGTAPTQVIAGFYDPKYVLIGDADMDNFDVADWSKLLLQLDFDPNNDISCVQSAYRHKGHYKPIYSTLDRSDPTYPVNYYRIRYAAKPYAPTSDELGNVDTAIFEAIGLEDRLLLITNRGLVPFYGHSHATVSADIAWTYRKKEVLSKCFKIVRILHSAQPNTDLIVGITYDYTIEIDRSSSNKDHERVSQEIWVGRYLGSAREIDWIQITPRHDESMVQDEISLKVNDDGHGEFETFKAFKDPGLPIDLLEVDPGSQIEAICFKAYRTVINKESPGHVHLEVEPDWCAALDATPVPTNENAIQVLVRMKTLYIEKSTVVTPIYFYVLATHIMEPDSNTVEWMITSVLPRYPCVDEHREAVRNVFAYDKRYFERTGDSHGCYWAYLKQTIRHIFLHGITYTRSRSKTVFLYGSVLLQSLDEGQSWMFVTGFPKKLSRSEQGGDYYTDKTTLNVSEGTLLNRPVHRISRMVFDTGGHYAFLTNKLELWFGSVGSENLIQLRPGPIQSMIQMGLSKLRNIHDAVPFFVGFDANDDKLYEMVAIIGEHGNVASLSKRSVREWKLFKAQTINKKFEERRDEYVKEWNETVIKPPPDMEKLKDKLQTPFNYDKQDWTTFCAYTRPSFKQNFSRKHSRTRTMYLPAPEQHLVKGLPYTHDSLIVFQAVTFSLVWESYFNTTEQVFASNKNSAFLKWVTNRRYATEAMIKEIKFSQRNPSDVDTILVEPYKYKPLFRITLHNALLNYYYLDLNVTAELRLEFSLRDEFDVLNPKFVDDQINDVEINVENADGEVIQTDTEKEIHAGEVKVLFIVRIQVKPRAPGLRQVRSGHDSIIVPVTYHFFGGFGKCIKDDLTSAGDKIDSVVVVGCPPNLEFVFDWNATLNSIELRSDRIRKDNEPQVRHGLYDGCYDNEDLCIWGRSPITLFFEIFDRTKQVYLPYVGPYTMRVIAGGSSKDSIEDYRQEEIEAFNFPGISDVSAIWALNKQREGQKTTDNSKELLLTSGKSRIKWECRILSPCARLLPTGWGMETIFWLRIRISNRNLKTAETGTLCLFEKDFDIMLYGFEPSQEYSLAVSIIFSGLFVAFIYGLFLCTRRDKKNWKKTKQTVKNGFFVIKNGFPKKLRYFEPPLPEDPEKPKRRRKFIAFEGGDNSSRNTASSYGSAESEDMFKRDGFSTMEIEPESDVPTIEVIPPTSKGRTFQQLMYEQILARRLRAVVERNRTMRSNLLKKAADAKVSTKINQELDYARQFGKTVSQEDLFTPPVPKATGGFGAFL